MLFTMGVQLSAQTFPAGGDCPGIASGCASPAVSAVSELPPLCANTRDYKLRVEFAAGGTSADPSAFRDHYWVMEVITKDSCVYRTRPFTVGTTDGPTYVATTGNSLVVDVAPGDLTFVTGGKGCTVTSAPDVFGGLDSVVVSLQQRCDSPGSGCSPFSAKVGQSIPLSFDMIVSKSNFQSAQDSSFYGYCATNRTIYVDGLSGEEETFNLAWYKDYQQTSQFVYVCVQDWAPIAATENYELQLTHGSNVAFDQTVANGWTEPGDSVLVTTEQVNGQTCYKITYSLDGDGMINAAMNTKIKAKAVGSNCETVTEVRVDTAATAFNKFKIGWKSNMFTTNHKFKVRIYQGGSCASSPMNLDTVATRPDIDNSYIHDVLIGANSDKLTKIVDRDTIGGVISVSDSFTLDLSDLGFSLEGCTCFQAFVFQICDGTNTGAAPTWSAGVNVSTDCNSCEDGIQNGDETGVDCGGYCTPCGQPGTSTCSDGIQNGNETGIDCGGSCSPCQQQTPTCADGVQNGDETGIDCGGSCAPCEQAQTPTCADGVQNGDETGIDCGGACAPCQEQTPTCEDRLQNGDETGVDCGGSCAPCFVCPLPEGLSVDNFARGRVTLNWNPVEGATLYYIQIRLEGASNWYDFRTRNTAQTIRGLARRANYEWRLATDCAGVPSAWTEICTFNSDDPATGNCGNVTAPTPTCEDGVQNGDEEGIDCGGTCAPCAQEPTATCEDGVQNGDETGIDCGGSCTACQEETSCPAPTGLTHLALGANAILSWERQNEASLYVLQVRLQGDADWTEYRSGIHRYLVSRLRRGQVYEWRVQSVCGASVSDWSDSGLFIAGTPGSAAGVTVNATATARSLQLFPNPATDILNVVIPVTNTREGLVHVLDMNGKRWITQPVAEGHSTLQLNVSGLPKGLYLIRHESKDEVRLQRVLIQ